MRVTDIGHSHLPLIFPSFRITEIYLFKKGGVLNNDLLGEQGRLDEALTKPCDVITVFLRGNELTSVELDLSCIALNLIKQKLIQVA